MGTDSLKPPKMMRFNGVLMEIDPPAHLHKLWKITMYNRRIIYFTCFLAPYFFSSDGKSCFKWVWVFSIL